MIELGGTISTDGKLSVYRQEDLMAWIKQNKEKAIVLSLKIKRMKRSNPQNSYYWGVVIPLVQKAINEYGNEYDSEDTHEFLKKEFNYKEVEIGDGYFIKLPESTTKLNTAEFNEYKEKIQQFASQVLNIYIPDPNEQTELHF